jgi:hypothetical protein
LYWFTNHNGHNQVRFLQPYIYQWWYSFTVSFRIGVFGVAANMQLAEDNRAAGDEGVGNYG